MISRAAPRSHAPEVLDRRRGNFLVRDALQLPRRLLETPIESGKFGCTGSLRADPGSPPEISIVLPCYRGAALARRSAAVLGAFLPALSRPGKSGCRRRRRRLRGRLGSRSGIHPSLAPAGEQGKGAAVRTGMLAAAARSPLHRIDLPSTSSSSGDRRIVAPTAFTSPLGTVRSRNRATTWRWAGSGVWHRPCSRASSAPS